MSKNGRLIVGIYSGLLVLGGIVSMSNHTFGPWQYVLWLYLLPIDFALIIGDRKGRLVLGAVLGILLAWIGVVIMMIVTQAKTASTHRECPHCRVVIRKDASVCPNCHRDISPSL